MKKLAFLSFFLLLCFASGVLLSCDSGNGTADIPSLTDEGGELEGEDGIGGEDNRKNEFEFTSNGDGTCRLSKAVYVKGELTIPEVSPDGEKVTDIGVGAFGDCEEITSLIIPDSIENINEKAFINCRNLEKVTVGVGLEEIGKDAFLNCVNLKEVHIFDLSGWCRVVIHNSYANPLAYGNTLFLNGEIVTDLVIPDDISAVKQYTFDYCSSIVSVTLHENVSEIEYGAFSCCVSIEEVIVSENLRSIGDYAFYRCMSLESLPTLDNVKNIGKYAFAQCESLTEVNIPAGVESIDEYAFSDCIGIKELTIDEKVQSIDTTAFANCGGIEKATIPVQLSSRINCKNMVTVAVFGNGAVPSEMCAFAEKLSHASIGDGIESVGRKAFKGCMALEEIVLPKSITSIGNNAFEYCVSLKTIYFSGSEAEWNVIDGIDEIPDNATVIFNYVCPSDK